MLLEKINSPEDLRQLPESQLPKLADEIRQLIIETVSRNGGHLASNLGTVELTIALHRVFDTPKEPLIFDVGHQGYTHKILTGRREKFGSLRKFGGISGFPHPEESPYDVAVCGHAGVAISVALGMAESMVADKKNAKAVAVIGDGAFGCGISFEALNSVISKGGKNLVVILNDNQWSISHNVGALTRYFNHLIAGTTYNYLKAILKEFLTPIPRLHNAFGHVKEVVKNALLPKGTFFESLGLHYLGPVDGHDLPRLLRMLERIKKLSGPVLLHVVTTKGKGLDFAVAEPTRYHGVSGFDVDNGEMKKSSPGYSQAFSKALTRLGEKHKDVVAISAAMLPGTGLTDFCSKYPERCFDVGIAEEHAVAFAAGLAIAGKRPICAFYSTFLQRALDLIYHDVALANLPVIFAVDRSGVVDDGPTHHGIYELSFLLSLPNLTLLSPRDEVELEMMLNFAYELKSPVVIRYPRGCGARSLQLPPPAPIEYGKAQILRWGNGPVLWSMGAEADTAIAVADILQSHKITSTVVNSRFLKPFDKQLAATFAGRPQFAIENHVVSGGLTTALRSAVDGVSMVHGYGWGEQIPGHGDVRKLKEHHGLLPEQIAEDILCRLLKLPLKKID